jgi:hypothetical protein
MTARLWTLVYIGFVLLVVIGAYDVYVAVLNDAVGDTISNVWATLADWWPPLMLWFGIAGGHMGTHAEPYLSSPEGRWFVLAWCTVAASLLSRAGWVGNGRWSVVLLISAGAALGATLLSQETAYSL